MRLISVKTREEYIATAAAIITATHYDYLKAVTVAEQLAQKLEEAGHAPWLLDIKDKEN